MDLQFENKYTEDYSKVYYFRHKRGILKRFSNMLEQRMIAKSLQLAGSPKVVLDLPCGAGRFLKTTLKNGAEKIIAADKSTGMLQTIKKYVEPSLLNNVQLMEADAFKIDLPDKSVDNVLCIRLLHHIHDPAHRAAIYKELCRVARESVIITFWVEGNYKSYREAFHPEKKKRCLNVASLENELKAAGFAIAGKVDMLKYFLYWRSYVLKV